MMAEVVAVVVTRLKVGCCRMGDLRLVETVVVVLARAVEGNEGSEWLGRRDGGGGRRTWG